MQTPTYYLKIHGGDIEQNCGNGLIVWLGQASLSLLVEIDTASEKSFHLNYKEVCSSGFACLWLDYHQFSPEVIDEFED